MIYDIDYPSLGAAEKKEFVHHFGRHAHESFKQEPNEKGWLAQLLTITRCLNSYRMLPDGNPEPEVFLVTLEQLWDVLGGQITMEEFRAFQKKLAASLLDIMTGDDSELAESDENLQFYLRYFMEWNHFYTIVADAVCTLCEEITSGTANWWAIEGLLYSDIGDNIVDYFEEIYTNPTGGYKIAELELRESQAYQSPTFCKIVALIQQDMKTAICDEPMLELKRKYCDAYLLPQMVRK